MRGNKLLKIVDFYIGIPIVFLLGLIRNKRKKVPSEIRKIGILETAAIGDTIIASAVINDLQKKFENAEIILFCSSDNVVAAQMFIPNVKVVLVSLKNIVETLKMIRSFGKFDVWMDFGPWPRLNAIISNFAKKSYCIGFKSIKQHRHFIFDVVIEHSDKVHEIENVRNLVKTIGVDSVSLPLLKMDRHVLPNTVVIHMFSGGYKGYNKEWAMDSWVKLIQFLTKKSYNIYLTGTRTNENAANLVKQSSGGDENIHVVAGKYSLYQTAQLIANSELVITVNTGILHLAAAIDTPIIALEGPVPVLRWGSLSKKTINITSSLQCSPCLHLGFDYKCRSGKCMHEIEVEDVIKVIQLRNVE